MCEYTVGEEGRDETGTLSVEPWVRDYRMRAANSHNGEETEQVHPPVLSAPKTRRLWHFKFVALRDAKNPRSCRQRACRQFQSRMLGSAQVNTAYCRKCLLLGSKSKRSAFIVLRSDGEAKMSQWMLICSACSKEFPHSSIPENLSFVESYLLTKPEFPPGLALDCPYCGRTATYERFDLRYRTGTVNYFTPA